VKCFFFFFANFDKHDETQLLAQFKTILYVHRVQNYLKFSKIYNDPSKSDCWKLFWATLMKFPYQLTDNVSLGQDKFYSGFQSISPFTLGKLLNATSSFFLVLGHWTTVVPLSPRRMGQSLPQSPSHTLIHHSPTLSWFTIIFQV